MKKTFPLDPRAPRAFHKQALLKDSHREIYLYMKKTFPLDPRAPRAFHKQALLKDSHREIYLYKELVFLRVGEKKYMLASYSSYKNVGGLTEWQKCSAFDFAQAKYYGKLIK